MNLENLQLTTEQQFRLKVISEQCKTISIDEARVLLVEITRQNMIKDNVIRDLFKNN
jgi:hypothetical protein